MLSAPGCVGCAPLISMISRDIVGLSMSMHGMSRLWLKGCRLRISLKYVELNASSRLTSWMLSVAKCVKMHGSTQPALLMCM